MVSTAYNLYNHLLQVSGCEAKLQISAYGGRRPNRKIFIAQFSFQYVIKYNLLNKLYVLYRNNPYY